MSRMNERILMYIYRNKLVGADIIRYQGRLVPDDEQLSGHSPWVSTDVMLMQLGPSPKFPRFWLLRIHCEGGAGDGSVAVWFGGVICDS